MTSKQPGPGGMRLFSHQTFNLSFDETFEERLPDAYERLLMDTARGNQTLFMRVDEVLAAWEFIDPILALAKTRTPVSYKQGSMGPTDDLLQADGRSWIDPHEIGRDDRWSNCPPAVIRHCNKGGRQSLVVCGGPARSALSQL